MISTVGTSLSPEARPLTRTVFCATDSMARDVNSSAQFFRAVLLAMDSPRASIHAAKSLPNKSIFEIAFPEYLVHHDFHRGLSRSPSSARRQLITRKQAAPFPEEYSQRG